MVEFWQKDTALEWRNDEAVLFLFKQIISQQQHNCGII